MQVIPISLKVANSFVRQYHRHSLPTTGGKFAIGAEKLGKLVGVAISGRPVSRILDDGLTLEILRVCTNGTQNSNSFLYSASVRVAKAMGYEKVITYTLYSEPGTSLIAIGAQPTAKTKKDQWDRPGRKRKTQNVNSKIKVRWELKI